MTFSRAEIGRRLRKIPRQILTLLANGFVYPVSRLLPRRHDLWLFSHQDGAFAGNSKFLYLWVVANRPDLRAVWISDEPETVQLLRQRGLPVCRKPSLRAIWLAMRAGAYFYCHGPADISIALSGGALHVNLWHGVGLKSLGRRNPRTVAEVYGEDGWVARTLKLGLRIEPDILVTTSEFMRQHFADQFRLAPNQCPPLGYPRLDAGRDPALAELVRQFPGSEARALWPDGVNEVYAYLPTYRDSRVDFARDAIPEVRRLEEVLETRNAVLYIKPHRHTESDWPVAERVRLWPRGVDVDAALPHLSALITDYSSVHYDYIFHKATGSILYLFDEDEYLAVDRLLLYPLSENTAGWTARGFEELLRLIETGAALLECEDVARVRRKFWGDLAGPASPRIVAHVDQVLKQRRGWYDRLGERLRWTKSEHSQSLQHVA